MIQPWPTIHSEAIADYRIFSLRSDVKQSPRTGHEHQVYVLEAVDWVNIVPVTPNDELVMVEQYRHGTESVELEIPGGMVDAEDHSPEATAIRELREETGYEGQRAQIIGRLYPNPAFMNNRCYAVMVEECQLKHDTDLDHGEDMVTRLVPIRDLPDLVSSGQIRHSIVIASLYHFDLWRRSGKMVDER